MTYSKGMTERGQEARCRLGRTLLSAALLIVCAACPTAVAQSNADPALIAAIHAALPPGIPAAETEKAINNGIWNSRRTAVAIAINRPPLPSVLFVFLKQPSGDYLAGDISLVEDGNLGKLGISGRAGYQRFESAPIRWLHREDGMYQVVVRTRAWKAGKRYTVFEPLIITADGVPVYR